MEPEIVPVNSPAFEYVYVANQRCECGGYFAAIRQELRMLPSGPIDHITGRCQLCQAERAFDFDIHSFFGQIERYDRFRQTDAHFKEAMVCVREQRWAEAEAALRLVVDPDEGEPAFAWGYYHLAQVLRVQGRLGEARLMLERAAAIQPLEPEIQELLALL